MNPYWTDLQKYKEVELCTMLGNFQGNCPIYIRRYSRDGMTHVLHRHEMIQMNYLIKGSCRHLIGGKEAPVVKGDLLIIPPYIPVSYTHLGVSDEETYGPLGTLLDLTDLISQYAPNLSARMAEEPEIQGSMIATDGKIYGLPYICLSLIHI